MAISTRHVLGAALMMSFITLGSAPSFISGTRAQGLADVAMSGMNHQVSVTPVNIIDGRIHPERITDADAYRMFLLASLPQDGSPQESARQLGMFYTLNLTDEQRPQIAEALAEFAAGIKDAVKLHDLTAQDGHPDRGTYRAREKQLVEETVARIELILGPKRTELFHAFIQGEKSKMKIAIE